MSVPSPAVDAPSAQAIKRWGDWLWIGLFGLGLVATFSLAWVMPRFLPLIPLVLLVGIALSVLVRYPLLHLCLVLGGFVIIFNYDEGIQLSEIVFGLYYLGYLTCWFAYYALGDWAKLFKHPVDYAIAFYLIFAAASLALTVIFGGSLFVGANELRACAVLAFYFPVREAARDPRGLRALLATFVFIALVVAARNFLQYILALQDVGALWEIVQNRHRTNERLVMMALLGALVFFARYARYKAISLLLLALAAVFTASIMLGRSRTIWLAIGLAMFLVFVLSDRQGRVRLLFFGAAGFSTVLLVGLLFLQDVFLLVLAGLGDRLSTISTAGQRDVSMINRFYEWRTVWSNILVSPLVGHGFGVPYSHFNLLYGITEQKTFVHNAYLGLLYRHGFLGLGLVGFVVAGTFFRGLRLVRHLPDRVSAAAGLTALASLAALALAGMTEDVLLMTDGLFAVMFPLAVIAGLAERRSGEANA